VRGDAVAGRGEGQRAVGSTAIYRSTRLVHLELLGGGTAPRRRAPQVGQPLQGKGQRQRTKATSNTTQPLHSSGLPADLLCLPDGIFSVLRLSFRLLEICHSNCLKIVI